MLIIKLFGPTKAAVYITALLSDCAANCTQHSACGQPSTSSNQSILRNPQDHCRGHKNPLYENCALMGHYAASSGNILPTFRDNLSGPSGVENGANRLSQSVGKELPLLAA